MSQHIEYAFTEESYSVITLNRPDKRNAISLQMASQLKSSIEQAKQDNCKFLILTSADEDVFCAGGDLQDYQSNLNYEDAFGRLYTMKEVLYELVSFPVPTICLLSGNAYGGGCELATACDLRIAKDTTQFGFIQANLGILPGWGGGSLLYEKVHSSFAFQWITEAAIFDAVHLKNKGWIHKLIPAVQWEEHEILKPYMKNSLEQMRILKKQYKEYITSLSLAAKMNEEVRHCATLWNSDRHKQAINEFFNKN